MLISNINDGFINVGNEAPGNDELCKSVNLGEARLDKFLTHGIDTHLRVEFKYCGSGEGYKNYTKVTAGIEISGHFSCLWRLFSLT